MRIAIAGMIVIVVCFGFYYLSGIFRLVKIHPWQRPPVNEMSVLTAQESLAQASNLAQAQTVSASNSDIARIIGEYSELIQNQQHTINELREQIAELSRSNYPGSKLFTIAFHRSDAFFVVRGETVHWDKSIDGLLRILDNESRDIYLCKGVEVFSVRVSNYGEESSNSNVAVATLPRRIREELNPGTVPMGSSNAPIGRSEERY